MPFSSLRDSDDLARARSAFVRAWTRIVEEQIAVESESAERDRLAIIVMGLLPAFDDEDELVEHAVARFERAELGA